MIRLARRCLLGEETLEQSGENGNGIDYSVCVDVWKERWKRERVCGRE